MGFSAKQVQALRRNLDHRYVRTREANGRELSYIEGWYAISEANRIFGFDGWNRETIESRCVLARENRGSFLAIYIARVRITVHADGVTIIREGHGSGEGRGAAPGEAHDTALKAAETDATKRALATFGKPFGLALYGGTKPSSIRENRVLPSAPATGVRLVRNGNEPAVVPISIVDELRRRENADGFVQLDHRPNFSRGDKVSVLAGAFQDCFGLYEGMSGRDRVMVLLDLLGRKVRVVLDAEFIEAA